MGHSILGGLLHDVTGVPGVLLQGAHDVLGTPNPAAVNPTPIKGAPNPNNLQAMANYNGTPYPTSGGKFYVPGGHGPVAYSATPQGQRAAVVAAHNAAVAASNSPYSKAAAALGKINVGAAPTLGSLNKGST